jgi:hypothetical protein
MATSFSGGGSRSIRSNLSGTENPADEDSRQSVAVEKETGGSYVVSTIYTKVYMHY